MHASEQKLRRMTMAQIVKSNAWKVLSPSQKVGKLVGKASWLQRKPIGTSTDQRVVVLANTQTKQLLDLVPLVPPKLLDRKSGQGDCSDPLVFRRFEPKSGFGLLQTFSHPHGRALEIEIFPAQRQHLSATHAGGKRHQYRPIKAAVLDGL